MPDKTIRITIPKAVRQYVLDRDNHQCKSCGKTSPHTKLEIDHIIPLANGGSNDLSNLQTLCRTCNAQKRDRFDPRFDPHFH
ncbi:HNH endonuclease [Alkalinema pantanalense CENA528]